MTIALSVAVRNAMLDAIEIEGGEDPILMLRTGSAPANCAAADTGTVLATFTLPTDWMAAASSGSKSKSGTWQDLSADASGVAAHFRIYKSDAETCFIQGSVGLVSSGADMELDNTSIEVNQQITVSAFTLTSSNA